MSKLRVLPAFAVVACLAAMPASAATPLPQEPALDQYVASVPTAEGDVAPKSGALQSTAARLPQPARGQLQRDVAGRALVRLAESPSLGAPTPDAPGGSPRPGSSAAPAGPGGGGSVTSAITATLTDGSVMPIFAILAILTAAGAVLRIRRGSHR